MRIATFLIVTLLVFSAHARAADVRMLAGPTIVATSVALDQAQQPPKGEIDININHGGGRAWWASPVWIAIGVLALVVLILLIVLATRGGGGTTIIRE
jgi:hypothetical protein